MYFYLTINTNNCEPDILKSISYIHIKCKADGSQTAIISKALIEHEYIAKKSQEELQTILNMWIDEENVHPEQDIAGNDIVQTKIQLNKYLKE